MVVAGQERRWWRLLADEGDGPFIPAVATRALLRRETLPPGAGPALEVITLDEAEAAMSDLRVHTERGSELAVPLFPSVLGPSFEALPAAVKATHVTLDDSHWQGKSSVVRGTGWWSGLLGRLFGFPASGDVVPVEVTKTVTPRGEIWQRRFGSRVFRSRLSAPGAAMTESFGPFTFILGLKVQDGALHFPVQSGRFGPLPLPRWILPVSISREHAEDGRFNFDVRILAPITRSLMVHYRGYLVEQIVQQEQ
jgi:hypothetical protein